MGIDDETGGTQIWSGSGISSKGPPVLQAPSKTHTAEVSMIFAGVFPRATPRQLDNTRWTGIRPFSQPPSRWEEACLREGVMGAEETNQTLLLPA